MSDARPQLAKRARADALSIAARKAAGIEPPTNYAGQGFNFGAASKIAKLRAQRAKPQSTQKGARK